MPIEAVPAATRDRPLPHPLAARRTLRLAFGTSLCLLFSQLLGQLVVWPLSFVAPVFTLLILGLPMPALSFKQGAGFVVAMMLPLILAMGLLPLLEHARWAGISLLALALFHAFYFGARGGSPVLGNFITIGLTLVVTVGSVSPTLLSLLLPSLAASAAFGIAFVAVAHALLPDPPPDPALAGRRPPGPPKAPLAEARRGALRAFAVVFPIALLFLFSGASTAFTPVMIKVASLGQQACVESSRTLGRSLLASTFWGGLGAVVCWQVLAIWPSLLLYTLLIGLAALIAGRRIFAGPGLHPEASMVSYALLTGVVLLGPAVLDSPMSSAAGAAFWSRLWLFVIIAVYGTVSVAVFDAFWPARDSAPGELGRAQEPARQRGSRLQSRPHP